MTQPTLEELKERFREDYSYTGVNGYKTELAIELLDLAFAAGRAQALEEVEQIVKLEENSKYNDPDNYGYYPFTNIYEGIDKLKNK